uniref:Spermatogenesis-associated protein 13 n=1 Tax=Aceria tosichella TaxID=561515 RepID=A0A6G1SKV0_9ACAR
MQNQEVSPSEPGTQLADNTQSYEEPNELDTDNEQKIAKRLRLRANVVLELINSERDFVQHLKDVVEGYLYRARKHPEIFTAQRIKTIFANIEQLYEFQREFLDELEKCINWSDLAQSRVGRCFLQYEKGFSVYHYYCNNHPNATSELQELYTKPIFRTFFEECRLKQNMIDISLNGFLLTPIQKICKYPLQLNELLKNTAESHPDYIDVLNALKSMRNCANLANERKRRIEALADVMSFQEKFENWSGPKLSETSSILIHSGEVSKMISHTKSQGVQLFLFDHLLLYSKRDMIKRNNLILKGRICMDTVTQISDADEFKPRKSFKLFCSEQQNWFVFTTKTEKEKDDWIRAFENERNLVESDEMENFKITDRELGIARRTLQHRKRSRSARYRHQAGRRPDTAIVDQLELDDADMMINRTLSLPSCIHPSHVMNFVEDSRVVSNASVTGSPVAGSQHSVGGMPCDSQADQTSQQSGPGNWLRKMGSKKLAKSQIYQINGHTGQTHQHHHQSNQSPTAAGALPTIKIVSHQISSHSNVAAPIIDVDKAAIKYDELEKRHRDHMVSEQQARLYRLNNDLPPPPTLFPRSLTPTPFSGTNLSSQGQSTNINNSNNHVRPKSSPSHHRYNHQNQVEPSTNLSPPMSPHPKLSREPSPSVMSDNHFGSNQQSRHSRRDLVGSFQKQVDATAQIDGQLQSLRLQDDSVGHEIEQQRAVDSAATSQTSTFETELVLSSGRVIRVREDAV